MIFHKSYPNPHLNSSEVQGTAGDLSLVVYQVDFDPVSSTPSGCQQYQCGSWWEQGSEGRFWIHQSSHAESCLRDERRDPLARSSKFTTQTQTTTGQPIVAPTPDMLEEGGEVCKNLLFAEITVFAFVSRLFEKERLRQNEKKTQVFATHLAEHRRPFPDQAAPESSVVCRAADSHKRVSVIRRDHHFLQGMGFSWDRP